MTASYFKPIEYIPDPYERAKIMESDYRKKQKSMEGEQAFKPNNFETRNKVLNPDQAIYGEDV